MYNPYTRGLAAFVAGLRYEQIPDEVRHRIKLLILDSLGCALYGVRMEWTKILIDTLADIDATRTCSVWGTHGEAFQPRTPRSSTERAFKASSSTTSIAMASCMSVQSRFRRFFALDRFGARAGRTHVPDGGGRRI